MAIVFDCNSNVIVITDCRWNATSVSVAVWVSLPGSLIGLSLIVHLRAIHQHLRVVLFSTVKLRLGKCDNY